MPETTASWVPVLAIVAAFLAPTVATVVAGYVANQNAKRAAEQVKQVEKTLAVARDENAQNLAEIHALVNSRLSEALKKIEKLEARLYEQTGEPPTGEPPPPRKPETGDD